MKFDDLYYRYSFPWSRCINCICPTNYSPSSRETVSDLDRGVYGSPYYSVSTFHGHEMRIGSRNNSKCHVSMRLATPFHGWVMARVESGWMRLILHFFIYCIHTKQEYARQSPNSSPRPFTSPDIVWAIYSWSYSYLQCSSSLQLPV
jgi:hypothetical protein